MKEDTKLTGPEYELLYKLLCDIRRFKQLNEGTDRPVPAFVHRICNSDLEKFTDKMRDHMYKFWPAYFETCW
jgi:hypothetical protein